MIKNLKLTVLFLVFCIGLLASSVQAQQNTDNPIIPIEVLLGNPEKSSAKISHDGKYIAYVAPFEGVLNIYLRTYGKNDDRPITKDKGRGVTNYFWAYNNKQILYVQDQGGDENWSLFALDLETEKVTSLTPKNPKVKHPVQVSINALDYKFPNKLIIGLNERDPRIHDLYELDLVSGQKKLFRQVELTQTGFMFDNDMVLRGYGQAEADGGFSFYLRKDEKSPFEQVMRRSMEDAMSSRLIGFSSDNKKIYALDSFNRNSTALFEFDPITKTSKVIAEDPKFDVNGVIIHPTKNTIMGITYSKDRADYEIFDPEYKKDFEILINPEKGDLTYTSGTLDNQKWLLAYYSDDGPVQYYIYNRTTKKLEFLFNHTNQYDKYKLAKMQPVTYQSRDGLTIHGYLTLPVNAKLPVPMVLNVHGGPWARDGWGINPEAQFFANRGYACLQVNFRGSTGYGKEFLNAGNMEWGGKMQNDLTDAVQWAIKEGIADPKKVAIYGGSYGGYATLCGVTFTPDLFTAGVSIVGPSNLESFLNTVPPYWEIMRKQFDLRVGRIPRYEANGKAGLPKDAKDWNAQDKKDIEFLHSRSPLFSVNSVKVPMLIAQGANDPRVNRAESDQFVAAMKEHGLDVEYVVYPDEGHGFARPENRLDFYHRVDKFLAKVLGGRSEK